MARRVLIGFAALALSAASCRHRGNPAPTPTPSPASSVATQALARHFDSELKRARERWQEQPDLGKCAEIMHETADAELCRSASSALGAVERLGPTLAPEAAIPALATCSLALARLLDRVRYLTFDELGRRRLDNDGGAPAGSTSAAVSAPPSGSAPAGPHSRFPPRHLTGLMPERPKLEITDSPMSQLLDRAVRLERDALRNLGAYLEYAPLAVRRAAFDASKQLEGEHPAWPALHRVLREAAVLETDTDLKRELEELSARTLPHGRRPDQPTGSK